MITEYLVKHYQHVCTRSFDEVVAAFEQSVGDGDDGKFLNGMKALSRSEDWEALCSKFFGPSGFVHVLTFDHGHWLKLYGSGLRARQYTYGNPLLAYTMVRHDIEVCFQVPFRVLIFETAKGEVRIAYDLPSSLMARIGNAAIDEAAQTIDPKVIGFASELAGAPA